MNGKWFSRKNLQSWFVLFIVSALAWFKSWPPEYVVLSYAMTLGVYSYFNVKEKWDARLNGTNGANGGK